MATDVEELAKRGFGALAEGGVDASLQYVHPDFEMETLPGIAAEPQVYRGHEGIRRWWDTFYEVMDEVIVEADEVTEIGPDRALISFRMQARGHASGIEVTQEARAIATVRDGLMFRLEFLLPGQEPG